MTLPTNTWQLPPCISCLKSLSHGRIASLHITANHPCDYTCKVKWLTKQLELCGNKYFLIVLLFLIWFNSNLLKCFVLHSVITARKVPITQLCHKSTFLSKSIQVLYCKYTILINEWRTIEWGMRRVNEKNHLTYEYSIPRIKCCSYCILLFGIKHFWMGKVLLFFFNF